MKSFKASLVLTALLALAPVAFASADKSLPSDFRLKGLAGGAIKPADLKGKRVVLEFFASWCEGCGQVMGELGPMLASANTIRYVPVSVDESMSEAKDYFKHQSSSVRSLEKVAYLDLDSKLASGLDVKALPALVVIDTDGHVITQVTGHPNKKQVAKIKSLIGK